MSNDNLIVIDGNEVPFEEGETVLEVAAKVGLDIPTLCYDPRLDPAGKDAADLTRTVASTLEQAIADRPAQWLWMYKRWKYVPQGQDPSRFPYYARSYKSG